MKLPSLFFTSSHSQIHSFTWHFTVGRSPAHKDPADEVGPFAARAGMIETLEQLGFESLHVYDEVREYCTSAVITKVHKNALSSLSRSLTFATGPFRVRCTMELPRSIQRPQVTNKLASKRGTSPDSTAKEIAPNQVRPTRTKIFRRPRNDRIPSPSKTIRNKLLPTGRRSRRMCESVGLLRCQCAPRWTTSKYEQGRRTRR